MEDKEIKCTGADYSHPCPYNATFIFTVKDQAFYKEQGFQEPKRCRDCREAKKAMKDAQGGGEPRQDDHRGQRGHRVRRNGPSFEREIYGADSGE